MLKLFFLFNVVDTESSDFVQLEVGFFTNNYDKIKIPYESSFHIITVPKNLRTLNIIRNTEQYAKSINEMEDVLSFLHSEDDIILQII